MVRRKQTAADFPPEFMDAWVLAGQGKLMLTMNSIGEARNMIQRLYTFRKRLMEEAPAIATAFYLVDLRVHDEAGNVITGKPTNVPQRAIIKVFSPTWKEQIRKQSERIRENDLNIPVGDPRHSGLIPIGEENLKLMQEVQKLHEPEIPGVSGDNLSEAIHNAGYSTEK